MKKWTLLDQASTPDGGTLGLYEHDGTYVIRINGMELMSTRRHASEEALAERGCQGLQEKTKAKVLIGGLGFGFTLKAALKLLRADALITVAELLPQVVQWNKDPRWPLADEALRDARVKLVTKDVMSVLTGERGGFDALLLDIDNGNSALTDQGNSHLYAEVGLQTAKAALRPGGAVAYWSASQAPQFAKQMERAGFKVEIHKTRAHTTSGGWNWIFLGRA